MSRTKASFSHLPLSLFEGRLAQKLRFHIFHFHFLRDASHKSFVFTSSTCRLWGKSCTKASFSHLPLSLFEGCLAQKLRFHIFHLQIVREVSHEINFWKLADARTPVLCKTKCVLEDGCIGKLFRFPAGGCGTRSVIGTDHGRIGAAVELTVQASFSQLQKSSTFTFRGKSRTKASFHIPLLISGDGSSRWFCREKGSTEYKSILERGPPKCTTKWKSLEPTQNGCPLQKTKIIKNHQIRAVYTINFQKKLPDSRCRKCPREALWDILNPVFCRETIRNPCCGLRTLVFSPPRLFAWHVLACPSSSMRTIRPWCCHYLAAIVDEFGHDALMCTALITPSTYCISHIKIVQTCSKNIKRSYQSKMIKKHMCIARWKLSADFLNFGVGDFPFKIPFTKCFNCFNIVLFCFGAEIRFSSCNFWHHCAKRLVCVCVCVPSEQTQNFVGTLSIYYISSSILKQGVPGVPGGSVTNEDTYLPAQDPWKRTCGTVVAHLGAYKSQLVATIVPYIFIILN